MAWSDKKELTEGQLKAAQHAGIPADRAGYGAEYPKAVYREDKAGKDRTLNGTPILVQGQFAVETATVNNEDEELEAMEQGWFTTPDLSTVAKKRDAIAERDAEIASLKAQLESGQQRRSPGRPKAPEASPSAV
jgi:hypothetical protein